VSAPTPQVEVVTFGCRLNHVESQALAQEAERAGGADVIVVNTCAVTAESTRQARQAIRRLHRERPGAEIIVTGCAAQIEPQTFKAIEGVTRVVGNADKSLAAQDSATWAGAPQQALAASENFTRSFIAIQNGCDHRCTFCIIPFGRGPSRSAPVEDVLAQARALVASGKREIVLTGVDLTSYAAEGVTLGGLAQRLLNETPDLPRLRLSSIDCIEADDALIEAMAREKRLMPHLHLSLQAGDDLILKRMKRRHSRAGAVRFCETLRAARPDIVFGADIIVGFPTETEGMFQRTLALVEDCGLTHLHVFPFSPRPGTPAALMPQVSREVAKERAERLRAAGEAALARHLAAQAGSRLRVLTERGGQGRAEDFTQVRTPGLDAGLMLEATATGHDGKALLAKMDAPRYALAGE
jgi:threonylcarbamoyladenosine tRNA methylthiotransferase MtaB